MNMSTEKTKQEYHVQTGCVLRVGTDKYGDYSELVELPSDKGWVTEQIMMSWPRCLNQSEIDAIKARKWTLRGNHGED